MGQPEGKLVKKAREFLTSRGARPFKIHGGDNPFQEVGIPDLLCCYRGRFVGLEAKEPGNKPSPVQKAVLHEIVEAGGYAVVFTTVGQVSLLLAKIDREVDSGAPSSRADDYNHRISLLRRSYGSKEY